MPETREHGVERKSRIIIKNLPLEASLEEVVQAFKPFGEM
jgi:hypothetical protein